MPNANKAMTGMDCDSIDDSISSPMQHLFCPNLDDAGFWDTWPKPRCQAADRKSGRSLEPCPNRAAIEAGGFPLARHFKIRVRSFNLTGAPPGFLRDPSN